MIMNEERIARRGYEARPLMKRNRSRPKKPLYVKIRKELETIGENRTQDRWKWKEIRKRNHGIWKLLYCCGRLNKLIC